MANRYALVIGSECDVRARLGCVEQNAASLFAVLTDPALGKCKPAVGGGLLRSPTHEEARRALHEAYKGAVRDEAALFLAFIGHGEVVENDFFLMLQNTPMNCSSGTAIELIHTIKELRRDAGLPLGLVTLLDTCYSGEAARQSVEDWVSTEIWDFRYKILAAAANQPAYDACFSRELTGYLKEGLKGRKQYVECEAAAETLKSKCPAQDPSLIQWSAASELWLTVNASDEYAAYTFKDQPEAAEIERLTADLHAMPEIGHIITKSKSCACVTITAGPGTGKSSICAALTMPGSHHDLPPDYVHSLVFLQDTPNHSKLVGRIASHLGRSVVGFAQAAQEVRLNMGEEDWISLPAVERELAAPLQRIAPEKPIRIVLDGLDHVPPASRREFARVIERLAGDELPFIRLILAGREDGLDLSPQNAEIVRLARPVPTTRAQEILREHGIELPDEDANLLVARLAEALQSREGA